MNDDAWVSRLIWQHMASAKGADSNPSMGQRPRIEDGANLSLEGATQAGFALTQNQIAP